MKKIISVLLFVTMFFGILGIYAAAVDYEYPFKTEDGQVRDPYVLVYEGKYYMYATCLTDAGYACVVSEDLENWSAPIQVFTPYDGFDGDGCYWAPECHYYNGSFYLFATYHSSVTGFRGTAVFKSDSPTGPFELISDGHVTPKNRDCIDGTLYIDGDGQPWMVYVNEWTTCEGEEGEMAAAKLSAELDELISEPVVLFKAKEPLWTNGSVTDGPCMYRTSSGKLIMLWSNVCDDGYAVGIAYSDNGEIDGNWYHQPFTLYTGNMYFENDGGHPMIFTDLNGVQKMLIHSPNSSGDGYHETAVFYEFEDVGDTIILKTELTGFKKVFYEIRNCMISMYYTAIKEIKNYVTEIFDVNI